MKDDSVRHTKTTQGRGWASGNTPTILGGLCKIQPEKGPDSPLFVTREREGYDNRDPYFQTDLIAIAIIFDKDELSICSLTNMDHGHIVDAHPGDGGVGS